jgi:hypothetical protein
MQDDDIREIWLHLHLWNVFVDKLHEYIEFVAEETRSKRCKIINFGSFSFKFVAFEVSFEILRGNDDFFDFSLLVLQLTATIARFLFPNNLTPTIFLTFLQKKSHEFSSKFISQTLLLSVIIGYQKR